MRHLSNQVELIVEASTNLLSSKFKSNLKHLFSSLKKTHQTKSMQTKLRCFNLTIKIIWSQRNSGTFWRRRI